MSKRIIFIVDDNASRLKTLETYLKAADMPSYELMCVNTISDGLMRLKQHQDNIDVIILSRALSKGADDALLTYLKSHKLLSKIPVILELDTHDKKALAEDFKLGVYHYLIWPFIFEELVSILQTALDFHAKQRDQFLELKSKRNLLKYIDKAVFKIQNLDDVESISISLAKMYPDPQKVVLGITEILTNAVEHGNLNITYDEKTQLNMQFKWKDEIDRRLKLPENQSKFVYISFIKNENDIVLNVKDAGKGFQYKSYMDFDVNRVTDNHGRGIAFANNLSFDKLEYVGNGNEVNCYTLNRK